MNTFKIIFYLSLCLCFEKESYTQTPVILWQKCLGGTFRDYVAGTNSNSSIGTGLGYGGSYVKQTTDGGYIVGGQAISTDGDVSGNHNNNPIQYTNPDYWIVKLTSTGNIQWQKCIGGFYGDCLKTIDQTLDGGYIVAGYTNSNGGDGDVVGPNRGWYDWWIVKISATGNIQWSKRLGGENDDKVFSIQPTTDGGYISAGYTSWPGGGDVSGFHAPITPTSITSDAWIVKLNNSGIVQWQKCLGGTNSESAYSIQQTSDGGYIYVGQTNSNDGDVSGNHGGTDIWIVKTNNSGNIQWQKCIGGTGNEIANVVQQTADNGHIIVGQSNSTDGNASGNHGEYDAWIVKLNSTGTIQWQKMLGGSGYDFAYSIKQIRGNSYIIAGETNSTDGDIIGNHGGYDAWIVELNSTGSIQWQKCLGGTSTDGASTIQQTLDGNYIVAGTTGSNNGDVSGNHGSYDIWVVKLSPKIATGIEENIKSSFISVFPNPANTKLQLPEKLKTIKIYNLNGQLQQTDTETDYIDIQSLNNATYFIKGITQNGQQVESKFIKQ